MTLSAEERIKRVDLIQEVLVERLTNGRERLGSKELVRHIWHDLIERKLVDKPSERIIASSYVMSERWDDERLMEEIKAYFRVLAWMFAELGIDRQTGSSGTLAVRCADAERLLNGAFSRLEVAMRAWQDCVAGQTGPGISGSPFDQKEIDSWFIDSGQGSSGFRGECAELRRAMDELGREAAIIGRIMRQACG